MCLAEILDVFLVVLLDVVQEFLAFKDFDVAGKADDFKVNKNGRPVSYLSSLLL